MDRDIMNELVKWKDSPDRKPLILTGVRQCGKTFVLKEFGNKYFSDVAYFNLEEDDTIASIFDHDYNTQRIIEELGSIVRRKKIVPGETIVILDEIQKCKRAITSFKYFCESMPELHIVGAGSLLGVALSHEKISFPVGKIDRLEMYPMSFGEFVCAHGDGALIDAVCNMPITRSLPAACTVPLEKHLKNYYIVGGMPEVVQKWIDTKDYGAVDKKLDTILSDYESDFSKYAPKNEITKIRQIWHSVPEQLARDNNKFVFSHVRKGARSKVLEDALEWLVDAGIVYKQKLVGKPELPLSYCADDTVFKVFFSDVGLLRRKSNVYYRTILDGDANYIRFKGAIAENYVLTEMVKEGLPQYYWRSGNTSEVDFLTEYQGRIIPVEVKSADNTKAQSLRQFIKKYSPEVAIKLSLKNVGDNVQDETKIYSVPLYCIFTIKRHMEQ